jgi:hypothetical protein
LSRTVVANHPRCQKRAKNLMGFAEAGAEFHVLKHDPEKWIAVFGKDRAQTKS